MKNDSTTSSSTQKLTISASKDGEAITSIAESLGDTNHRTYGNGSLAHQIIGEFIEELHQDEPYAVIAARLEAVVFNGKPTEDDLRTAIFGELEL